MSAASVVPLLPEFNLASPAVAQQVIAQPFAGASGNNSASPTKAAADIAAQYGFDGKGQTIAIIDSGIAWDHNALGGGFGAGYKVVGGWDFADNDALPYDSGSAGIHGTHVAGIVAAEHDKYQGVSSGVDLVSLRVFNDQGAAHHMSDQKTDIFANQPQKKELKPKEEKEAHHQGGNTSLKLVPEKQF